MRTNTRHDSDDPIWGHKPPQWGDRGNGRNHDLPELLVAEPAEKETDIPRREYVVPGFLQRGMLIELVGPAGAGKGQLCAAWGVALALGRSFGTFRPSQAMRVLHFSIEDDIPEQQARVAATLRWFGASKPDLGGRLRMATARDLGLLFKFDEMGVSARTALMEELAAVIVEFRPDLVILDPLAELHDMPENDNMGLRLVGSEIRSIARIHRLALLVVHHTRKGNADPGNMDVGRGASSMSALARKAFTVFPMTEPEAAGWKITRPDLYFRLDGAKANYDQKNQTEWFERAVVMLDNGDLVARCEPWMPPQETVTDQSIADLLAAVAAGDRGQPWSRRLGRYARSIAKAMERLGITSRAAQETALEALFATGVEEVAWTRSNRARAYGLRHPNGRPDVPWTD